MNAHYYNNAVGILVHNPLNSNPGIRRSTACDDSQPSHALVSLALSESSDSFLTFAI